MKKDAAQHYRPSSSLFLQSASSLQKDGRMMISLRENDDRLTPNDGRLTPNYDLPSAK
jgi:hypothetical protein